MKLKNAVVAATICLSTAAWAEPGTTAEPPSAKLDSTVTLQTGDVMAMQVNQFFASGAVRKKFDAPVFTVYSKAEKKVIVTILGARDKVEGARETLDEARAILEDYSSRVLLGAHGGMLDDSNMTIVYVYAARDWEKTGNREIVRREGGKYITP